ncbi:arginine repressor [Legionella spiritensis]|uniref:Arginine repressor n=1 Tax=Legionella spiritensis TaxID=452 RepID=A0A0W0YYJ4_LEGSP|nr:ArgR family transcriptional regulator [Legionella spiritensis]KTD61940.1 arginine repressor [Legionella spiritensis]SNV30990.1 argR arginine repressor [Legionella spiritensis]VEG92031.1 argR arginine repressor [Legionella spiritensis]
MSHDSLIDDLILNIVQTEPILEQNDLQQSLKNRGYDIAQATLSRRLKKLKIAKVGGVYKVVDYNQPGLPLVLNIQVSDFGLIILQTHPGNASSLAYYLDRKYVAFSPQDSTHSGIMGTIAGDDTVLLIVKSRDAVAHVCQLLREEFPYLLIPC